MVILSKSHFFEKMQSENLTTFSWASCLCFLFLCKSYHYRRMSAVVLLLCSFNAALFGTDSHISV